MTGGRLFAVAGPEPAALRLPDGVELVADIYRPDAPGRHPVLLMRQPYGRQIASTVVLAHPAWYAARGYIVVIQDVRGRGHSGGRFRVLEDDAADGAATLAWAADLPGSDGRVATYGFSYQAITQFMALAGARAGGKRPDAMVPIMGAWNVRDDWVLEGGAFRLGLGQYWAAQMGAEQARLAGDLAAYHELRAAAEGGSHRGPVPGHPDVLARHARYHHYFDWLAADEAYWQRVSPAALLAGDPLDVPALHVGGWQDFMLTGTWSSWEAFRGAGAARQELMIGPWLHIPWGRLVGAEDFGPAAGATVDEAVVAFLDRQFKGTGPDTPLLRLFDAGTGAWRAFGEVPAASPLTLHLASGGRAAPTTTDGRLLREPEGGPDDRIVHDPWRPAPSVGLHLGQPPGYCDRRAIDDRADVAVYTAEPLADPLTLYGPGEVGLWVAADRPACDLSCTLSAVWPDGRAVAFAGGHLRIADADRPAVRGVALRPTCFTLPAGARLRLSVQAAAWPAFAVNPGTGARPEDAPLAACETVTLCIGTGQSQLRLSTL